MTDLTSDEQRLLDAAASHRSRTAWVLLAAACCAMGGGVAASFYCNGRMRSTLHLARNPGDEVIYNKALKDLNAAGLLDESILVGEVEKRLYHSTGLFAGWACASIAYGGIALGASLFGAAVHGLGFGPAAKKDRLLLKLAGAAEFNPEP